MLNKTSILSVLDHRTRTVPVPEWGGDVCIRSMSQNQRDRFLSEVVDAEGKSIKANIKTKLLVHTLCDEQGKRLFDDGDMEALGERNADVLERLFLIAKDLNGFTDKTDTEALKN